MELQDLSDSTIAPKIQELLKALIKTYDLNTKAMKIERAPEANAMVVFSNLLMSSIFFYHGTHPDKNPEIYLQLSEKLFDAVEEIRKQLEEVL